MSKVGRKVNIRVVVEPDISGYWTLDRKSAEKVEKATIHEAERLRAEILRHVGDARPAVIWDTENQCSFCGDTSEWGNSVPTCCAPSVDEWGSANDLADGAADEFDTYCYENHIPDADIPDALAVFRVWGPVERLTVKEAQ